MFPLAAAGQRNSSGTPGTGKGARIGRWHSRVRGLPETYGELPVACWPRRSRLRARARSARWSRSPATRCVSTPNSERLESAIEGLDFMLAVDIYVNETTRHADVILPGPEPLEKSHYDLALYQLAVRNVANYSPRGVRALRAAPSGRSSCGWPGVLAGQGPNADGAALDDLVIATLVAARGRRRRLARRRARPAELIEALEPRRGPERVLDFMLRVGPYGDGFGAEPDGLTLDVLEAKPARRRPRPAPRARARGAAHAVGADRAGARADRRRRRAPPGSARARAERRPGADRPAPAALEQLVDAQPRRRS